MSLIPCDYCHKRVAEKLAQATTAWYRADGQRVAWRQRLCTQCYCTNILPLDKPVDFDNLTCPACGISTEHDMDPTYVTVYVPGAGKNQFEWPTCSACAVKVRGRAQEGAVKLEDRQSVEGPSAGPSTMTTRESYWSGIGIIPAEPTP
jgi:ribosomal protein S27AE